MASKINFKITSILVVSFLLMTVQVFAQVTKKNASDKLMKCFNKGVSLSKAGDHEEAIKHFNKAIKKDAQFVDPYIQKAVALDKLGRPLDAELNFKKAIAIAPDYDPRVYYALAEVEWEQKKFEEAKMHYEKFMTYKPKTSGLTKKANSQIEDAAVIIPAYKNPVPFNPMVLSENINTLNSEYLPSLSADEEVFVYTVRENSQEDLYISRKIDGEWSQGKPIEKINTPMDNEAAQSVSADGSMIIFTQCSKKIGFGGCDLYFSQFRNGRWTTALNLGSTINSSAWESQPSLTDNGRTLYFSSNREGGFGGRDIYVSYFENNKWTKPINIGEPVNTKGNEESPFVHHDGETLYFMSDGHPGLGSYDLFISRKNGAAWGEVKNLGYPINSLVSEGAMVVSLDGSEAYYATDRKYLNNSTDKPETDIYKFELHPVIKPQPVTFVKAKVRDSQTKKLIGAFVEIVDLNSNKVIYDGNTIDVESFLACLPAGRNYGLNVSKDGYLFYSDNFELSQKENINKPFILDIELNKIPEKGVEKEDDEVVYNQPVILKNVFFETGSAELKSASLDELNKLNELLIKNPAIKIQINGHTDNVGQTDANQLLSLNRAKAVYSFLIDKGIVGSRLKYQGFGESQPIDSNDTEEGRKNNRRTEFILLK